MVHLNYDFKSLISYDISSTSLILSSCAFGYCNMNKKKINFAYKSSSCIAFGFLPKTLDYKLGSRSHTDDDDSEHVLDTCYVLGPVLSALQSPILLIAL